MIRVTGKDINFETGLKIGFQDVDLSLTIQISKKYCGGSHDPQNHCMS